MERAWRWVALIVLIAATDAAAAEPLYPRDGSSSDRVVYAYFSRETVHGRLSVPVCDRAKGAPAANCVSVGIEQILPKPVKVFDAAVAREVVFIVVLADAIDRQGRPIPLVGRLVAPNGGRMNFKSEVATHQNASRYLIQQAIPRDALGAAFGDWMLMLEVDSELVGIYQFAWFDAVTAAQHKKIAEDLLTSDEPPAAPAIPPELFAPPPDQTPPSR